MSIFEIRGNNDQLDLLEIRLLVRFPDVRLNRRQNEVLRVKSDQHEKRLKYFLEVYCMGAKLPFEQKKGPRS